LPLLVVLTGLFAGLFLGDFSLRGVGWMPFKFGFVFLERFTVVRERRRCRFVLALGRSLAEEFTPHKFGCLSERYVENGLCRKSY
jgi:hypothetical protein